MVECIRLLLYMHYYGVLFFMFLGSIFIQAPSTPEEAKYVKHVEPSVKGWWSPPTLYTIQMIHLYSNRLFIQNGNTTLYGLGCRMLLCLLSAWVKLLIVH